MARRPWTALSSLVDTLLREEVNNGNVVARALLDQLVLRYEQEKPISTNLVDPVWILSWIVAANNCLYTYFRTEAKTDTDAEKMHESLADMLFAYHQQITSLKAHNTVSASRYFRDVILKQSYGFDSLPMLTKNSAPLTNPSVMRTGYYWWDALYSDLQQNHDNTSASSDESEGALKSPLIFNRFGAEARDYQNDSHFQCIVAHHLKQQRTPATFAGITKEKGGLITILSIILDHEASIRFSGPLGFAALTQSECAYRHGPYFMQLGSSKRVININAVRHVPLDLIIFILPNEKAYDALAQLISNAVERGLLTINIAKHVMETQVFTYTSYCKHFKIEEAPVEEAVAAVDSGVSQMPSSTEVSNEELVVVNSPILFRVFRSHSDNQLEQKRGSAPETTSTFCGTKN